MIQIISVIGESLFFSEHRIISFQEMFNVIVICLSGNLAFGARCEPQNAPYTICSLEVHIVYPAYTICSPLNREHIV